MRESCGPNPERPGEVAIGTVIEPVPVTRFAGKLFADPTNRSAPLGSEMDGAVN